MFFAKMAQSQSDNCSVMNSILRFDGASIRWKHSGSLRGSRKKDGGMVIIRGGNARDIQCRAGIDFWGLNWHPEDIGLPLFGNTQQYHLALCRFPVWH